MLVLCPIQFLCKRVLLDVEILDLLSECCQVAENVEAVFKCADFLGENQ